MATTPDLTFVGTRDFGKRFWLGPEGLRLSGGQRQRLALAQVLLVLDEAMANLDPATERDIFDRLFQLPQKQRSTEDPMHSSIEPSP